MLVESGAGDGAWLTDDAYAEAGASIVARRRAAPSADVVLMVGQARRRAGRPRCAPGQAVLGLLAPLTDPDLAAAAGRGRA